MARLFKMEIENHERPRGYITLEIEFELAISGIKQVERFIRRFQHELNHYSIKNCFKVFNRDGVLYTRTNCDLQCAYDEGLHLIEGDLQYFLQRSVFSSHISDALLCSGLNTVFERLDEVDDKLFNPSEDYISVKLRELSDYLKGILNEAMSFKANGTRRYYELFKVSTIFEVFVKVTAIKEPSSAKDYLQCV